MSAPANPPQRVSPTYWEIAPDGRTYTFHLNKNAKWHDGTDITAEDVQFSFDALANPDLGSSYSSNFLDATESWRVIDEHTFEVVAKEPLFTFLYELHSVVVPKHIWESVPISEWRTDGGATGQDPSRVVGSGPWKFQEWRQGESITLRPQRRLLPEGALHRLVRDPHLAGSDIRRQRVSQRRDRCRQGSSRPMSRRSRRLRG